MAKSSIWASTRAKGKGLEAPKPHPQAEEGVFSRLQALAELTE